MTVWETWNTRLTAGAKLTLIVTALSCLSLGGGASAQTGDPAAFAQLIKAAKAEGQVEVDGPPIDAVRSAITEAFTNKYGIAVHYISSGSSKSGARVRAERAAGRYLLDVFVSGADTPLLTFKPGGWLDPIRPVLVDPDVTDASKWSEGHLWFGDPEGNILRLLRYTTPNLAINTSMVKPEEIASWRDLLDPKWKGRIAAKDPSVSGSGGSLISYFYLFYGPDYVKALYQDQKPFISREPRQPIQWLAQGTYPIVVGPDSNELKRFMDLNYPIQPIFPKDAPGMLSGGWGMMALINKAPNPNAAKLFVNWMASREGLEVFAKTTASPSLRRDVSHDWAPSYTVPEEGREYVDTYEYNFIIEQRDAAFEKAKKLLGL
jgi:iron(III) transport system substrate-binding protein